MLCLTILCYTKQHLTLTFLQAPVNMHPFCPLILLCCLMGVTFAGTCGVSAPRITLSELHSGCDADSKSRHPNCVTAMHRFCQRVTYPSPITTFGVPRENADSKIHMSCVRSYWSGNLSSAIMQHHYRWCRIYNSQDRD